MKKLIVFFAFAVLLGLAGCSGAPAADPQDSSGGVLVLEREEEEELVFESEAPSSQEEDPLVSGEEAAREEPSASQAQPQEETPPAQTSEQTSAVPATETSVQEEVPAPEPEPETAPEPEPDPETAPEPEPDPEPEETQPVYTSTYTPSGEVKAVWISYLDFYTLLQGKSQSQFTSNIAAAFDNAKATGLNTVIVQVRPFGDALYESEIFPWSHIITGTEGVDPGFDPLSIMIREAHNRGLQIEAWINPYRIRTSGQSNKALSSDNPARSYINSGSDVVLAYGGGYYYNPGSSEAQELIVQGVREIVENYNVDGIHFDDYFYPTTSASFDSGTYQASGTSLSPADWRRENVNRLVRAVYAEIKSIDSSLRFGISPQGIIANNYDGQYSDVELWMAEEGYVDYICPQLYYGFNHATAPFASMVREWNSKIRADGVELYIGLAPYKLGTVDSYAGSGKNEWLNTSDILARMVEEAREAGNYGGFILFRYDSLYNVSGTLRSQVEAELESLEEIL